MTGQNKEALQDLQGRLKCMQIEILSVSLTREHNCYRVDLIVILPDMYQAVKPLDMFHDVTYIHEVDI